MHSVLQWFKPEIRYVLPLCLAREIKTLKGLKWIWNPPGLEREAHSQGIKRKVTVDLNEFQNGKFPRFGNILVSFQLHFQECRRARMYSWQLPCLLFSSILLHVQSAEYPGREPLWIQDFSPKKVLSGSRHIVLGQKLPAVQGGPEPWGACNPQWEFIGLGRIKG